MERRTHHMREEFAVIVSLAISLGLILISLVGWWLGAWLTPMVERITTMVSLCC